jgi:hypothetical protein
LPVAWDGTQVVADIGCGSGFDLRQPVLSTVGTGAMAEIWDLLYAAVSEQIGRPLRARQSMSFTTENGETLLRRAFAYVTLRRHDVVLSIPDPAPVTAYLDSMREPLLLELGETFDFDATLAHVAAAVEREVRANGRFRTVSRMGVFICR